MRSQMARLVAALALASVAPFVEAESQHRALQDVDTTLICRADISGPARGVPDGVINVMDVRHPLTVPFEPHCLRHVWCSLVMRCTVRF
jgi:hypothetical protein